MKKIKQILIIALFGVFYISCSNDAIDSPTTLNADISKYDNLKLVASVENQQQAEEVKAGIKKMFENLIINIVSSDSISPNGKKNVFKITNQINKLVRFKTDGVERGTQNSKLSYGGGLFNINIAQSWDENGNIKCETWGSGLSMFYTWEQTSVTNYIQEGNDWYNPISEVHGVVHYKILINGVLEIVTETVSFKVNGGVYPKYGR